MRERVSRGRICCSCLSEMLLWRKWGSVLDAPGGGASLWPVPQPGDVAGGRGSGRGAQSCALGPVPAVAFTAIKHFGVGGERRGGRGGEGRCWDQGTSEDMALRRGHRLAQEPRVPAVPLRAGVPRHHQNTDPMVPSGQGSRDTPQSRDPTAPLRAQIPKCPQSTDPTVPSGQGPHGALRAGIPQPPQGRDPTAPSDHRLSIDSLCVPHGPTLGGKTGVAVGPVPGPAK